MEDFGLEGDYMSRFNALLRHMFDLRSAVIEQEVKLRQSRSEMLKYQLHGLRPRFTSWIILWMRGCM